MISLLCIRNICIFAADLNNNDMKKNYSKMQILLNGVEKKADYLQKLAIEIRKELFHDPICGFDHNMGGVRTDASIEYATRRINAITDGFITFHFVSHRRLWFEFEGVDKRYTLHCANEYDFNTKESIATNPYNEIAVEVIKALKERDEMEKMYQHLIAA